MKEKLKEKIVAIRELVYAHPLIKVFGIGAFGLLLLWGIIGSIGGEIVSRLLPSTAEDVAVREAIATIKEDVKYLRGLSENETLYTPSENSEDDIIYVRSKAYSMEHPASEVTFNAIVDNMTEVGDERFFVSSSLYTGVAANNKWTDSTMVEEGKEYVVRMYVHNNAAANLNLIAENVRAYIVLPTTTGTSLEVHGKIYSSNASPAMVWDHTIFKSANGEQFNLALVDGSAMYHNTDQNGESRVFSLDGLSDNNDLFTDKGVLLGYNQLDGKIPGCMQYSGYVTFLVKPQFAAKPGTSVTMEVQVDGFEGWSEAVTAKSGDKVNYRIHFKNTGEIDMREVLIRDRLPVGMTYVNGSTRVFNSNHPDGPVVSDNIISNTGINIGDYAASGGAWVYFSATVDASVSEKASNTILRNVIEANGGYGTQEDTADVAVLGKEA